MGRKEITKPFSKGHGETEMKKMVIFSREGEIDHSLVCLLNELFPSCKICVVPDVRETSGLLLAGQAIGESL
jgi:hypothetical protein